MFDWQVASQMDLGGGGLYHLFHHRVQPLGGMFNRPPQMPVSASPYVRVPDSHATAKKVTERGGTVVHGPTEVPGGDFIVQRRDPQGVAFAVHGAKGE